MSTYKSNRVRKWISSLLLLQIVALLIPAHHVSAADQQVVIPKETVDAMVFQVLWQQALNEADNGETDAAVASVAEAKKTPAPRPTLPPGAARPRMTMEVLLYNELILQGASQVILDVELWDKYLNKITPGAGDDLDARRGKSYEEIMFAMFDAAAEIPELRPYVKKAWQKLAQVRIPLRNDRAFLKNLHIARATRSYGLARTALVRGPEVMQQVFESSQEIPEVAAVFDVLFSDGLGVSIKDFDAYDYIQTHPDDIIPPAIVDRMRQDGSVSISLNDLKEFSQGEFNKIHDSIEELQGTLLDIDAKQDVILDYIGNQQEREAMEALAAAEAAEHRLKLEAAQSSLFIAYTLADVIDPEFAYQLSVIGNSTIQVAESLNGWMTAIAKMDGLTQAGALSTIVMSGNVLGAVMNVVNLFGGSGPTPEQMILEEIGKLRQQVEDLRQQMHSRFDRIDEELNTIYATMQDRFNLIDIQLGKLNGKVDEVQKTLVSLDLKLTRLERNNFEFLDALGRRPLLEAINGSLGYQERTGEPMPFQPEFVEFENVLHGWATLHAFDPLAAGPTQRDYSAGQVIAELNAYPLDSNINYLNGWLMANGLPAIADERLPSPRDWIFANRAYTELALEWPEHMARINPQRQADLDAIGADIEEAMKKISTLTTMTGTVGNTLLFSNVITYYQDKLDRMEAGLEWQEANYLAEVRNSLQRSETFDLYGGVNQELEFKTPEVTTMTCGDPEGHGSFPATSNLKAMIPNFDLYNLAEYLKLGELSACLSEEYLDQYEHCIVDNEPPFSVECHMRGTHKAMLTVYFDDMPIMRQSFMGGDEAVGAEIVKPQWTSFNRYKELFEALPAADAPTPEEATQRATLLSETSAEAEATLADLQQELYRRILHEVNAATLRPLATELAGGKALLDSFVALGFSRAVAEDELLHSMLYGNQQLVDDSHIVQSYTFSASLPITGTGILVNPRLAIGEIAAARTAAFSTLLNSYLDAITAQTHEEVADYAANARRELEFTMLVAREADPPATPEVPTPETPTTPEPPTTPSSPVTPEPPMIPTPLTPMPPKEPSAEPRRMHLPLIES